MKVLKKYRKKPDQAVTAVQLDLDTEGFTYRKWGGTQTCRTGDWLVNNNGDVYTVGKQTFETTYRSLSPGVYYKPATVWAEQATSDGEIDTHEGKTHYLAGDYLVYNNPDRTDGYAVESTKFKAMYEPWSESG